MTRTPSRTLTASRLVGFSEPRVSTDTYNQSCQSEDTDVVPSLLNSPATRVMSLDGTANPVLSPSSEPTCQCKNLKIRSRLSEHRPAALPRGVWNYFILHRFSDREKKLHTFEKGKCILSPATCELCRLVSACFESTKDTRVSLFSYYVSAEHWTEDRTYSVSIVLRLGATQLVPLDIDAHLLGRNRGGFARSSRPSCTDRAQLREWLSKCELGHKACKLEDEHRANGVVTQPKWLINTRTMCIEQSNTTY